MVGQLTIRPETHKDYKDIVSLVLRSFREGTDYSDGTDIVALNEEIRLLFCAFMVIISRICYNIRQCKTSGELD